jgi:2Fe-2S ferredoxin
MIEVIFIEHGGAKHVVSGTIGESVMQTARTNGVSGIPADCGGSCACATCHVLVDSDWLARLPPIEEDEDTMLEFSLDDRQANSRLSCQIVLTQELDGLSVQIPAS